MKKTLILILVVLMALFTVSALTAQDMDPAPQTDTTVEEVVSSDNESGKDPAPVEDPAPTEEAEVQPGNDADSEETLDLTPVEQPHEQQTSGTEPAAAPEQTSEPEQTSGQESATTPEKVVETGTEPVTEPAAGTETITEPAANPTAQEPVAANEPLNGEQKDEIKDEPKSGEVPEAAGNTPIHMIVYIKGDQKICSFDETGAPCIADGFTITDVTCDGKEECPHVDEGDLYFSGNDHAELPGNVIGEQYMSLKDAAFELALDGVEVQFEVEEGYAIVTAPETEGTDVVIDQTAAVPEENPAETPAETEPEPEDQEPEAPAETEEQKSETPAEAEPVQTYTYSNAYLTIRVFKKAAQADPAADVQTDEEADTPAAENAAISGDEEETVPAADEESAETVEPGITENESEDEVDDEHKEELNEEAGDNDLTDETGDGNEEETTEKIDDESEEELTEEIDEETEDKELTDEVSDEIKDEELNEELDEEKESEEETPKSLLFTADMVIFTDADAESEALDFTTEESLELTVLSVDENGWALVVLPDGTQGYVQMPVEEAAPTEDAELTPAGAEAEADADTALKSIALTAETVIYAAADAEGEVVELPFEEGIELTILSIDENGWALVELPDGTTGYILMPAENAEEAEEKIPMIKEGTAVRVSDDGMSLVLYTAEGEMEVTILEVNDDWYKVELADGTVGYIFKKDLVDYKAPEEVVEKKVTIFSTIHPMMEVNEPITLTSDLEGFEDCVEINYQWECDKGSGFEPIEGAIESTYTFPATAESLTWSWQLVVNYE